MNKKIIISVMLILAFAGLAFAEAGVNDKIVAQKALELKVKGVLSNILGHKNFLVVVNAELDRSYSETLRETWKPNKSYSGYQLPFVTPQEELLPGVPSKQNFEGNTSGELSGTKTVQRTLKTPPSLFSKINVTVYLDKNTAKKDVDLVKKVVPAVLSLNENRGDTFKIDTSNSIAKVKDENLELLALRYQKSEQEVSSPLFPSLIKYLAILVIIGSLIALFFGRLKDLINNSVFSQAKKEEDIPLTGNELDKQEKEEEEKKEEVRGKYFTYINEDNVSKLKYILPNMDLNVAGAVLLQLPANLSAVALSTLSQELKEALIAKMSSPKSYTASFMAELDVKMKEDVENTVGGIEDLARIAEHLDEEGLSKMIQTLESKNPAFATELRRIKFAFEDIGGLSDENLAAVISEVDLKDLAIAMLDSKDGLKGRVANILTEEQKEIYNEWSEILGKTSAQKIAESKRNIAKISKRLADKGIISRNIERAVLVHQKAEIPVFESFPRAEVGFTPTNRAVEEQIEEPKAPKMKIDMVSLSEEDLALLISNVRAKDLAVALNGTNGEVEDKIRKINPAYAQNLHLARTILGNRGEHEVEVVKERLGVLLSNLKNR